MCQRRMLLLCVIALISMMGCGEENEPPTTPHLLGPELGSIVSIMPTLSWECGDPEGGLVTYSIYVDEKIRDNDRVSDWYEFSAPLAYDTTYTWHIVAYDADGNKSPGPLWSFKTEQQPVFEPDPVFESDPVYNERTPVVTVMFDESFRLSPGQYKAWELSLVSGDLLYEEIGTNSEVNIWLLLPREFEAFANGDNFHPIAAASRERTLGFRLTYTVPDTGKYHFVVDNKFSWLTSKSVSVYMTITR